MALISSITLHMREITALTVAGRGVNTFPRAVHALREIVNDKR